jgi:hypothetical protein
MAGWQSGHAAACKAVYAGSIPTPASIDHPISNLLVCRVKHSFAFIHLYALSRERLIYALIRRENCITH